MMMNVYADDEIKLTGRKQLRATMERVGLFKRQPILVLQLEESYKRRKVPFGPSGEETFHRWRDACVTDLFALTGCQYVGFDKKLTDAELAELKNRWTEKH